MFSLMLAIPVVRTFMIEYAAAMGIDVHAVVVRPEFAGADGTLLGLSIKGKEGEEEDEYALQHTI